MRDKSLQGNGGDSVRRTQCSFVFFWILWHKSRTFLHVIHPKVDHIFSHNAAFCCDEIVCQGQEGTVVCNPLCWLGPTWDIPLSLSICHSCSISLSLCLSLYLFLIISRSLSLYTSLSFTSPLYFSFSPSHFLCVSHSLSLCSVCQKYTLLFVQFEFTFYNEADPVHACVSSLCSSTPASWMTRRQRSRQRCSLDHPGLPFSTDPECFPLIRPVAPYKHLRLT